MNKWIKICLFFAIATKTEDRQSSHKQNNGIEIEYNSFEFVKLNFLL